MTYLALLLVSASAFTHAFWNFLSKKKNPQASFFLMASAASAVILSPLLVIFHEGLKTIPASAWGLIAVTGVVQSIYYIFLAAAYRTGDLSHAYPLARSLPVVFVALVSVLLGRGGQIQPLAYAGFLSVTAGCILLPQPRFSDIHPQHYRHKWVLFAFLAALCITGYTLIDDQALRILRNIPGTELTNIEWAMLFGELEGISITIFMGLLLFSWGPERQSLLRARLPEWKTAALMGTIITCTYGLVLVAMAYVSNVSYVFAFRQLSIPIGATLGMAVRKEKATPPKLMGIALVVVGLVLVAAG